MSDLKLIDSREFVAKDAVDILESLLEKAKNGEIECIAVATISMSGTCGTEFKTHRNLLMAGNLQRLTQRILRHLDD